MIKFKLGAPAWKPIPLEEPDHPMEIGEQLWERFSKELSRLPSHCAVVIMVIVTPLVTPPLLKWTLADRPSGSGN